MHKAIEIVRKGKDLNSYPTNQAQFLFLKLVMDCPQNRAGHNWSVSVWNGSMT